MNGELIIKAIYKIYPEIQGGFSYWNTKYDLTEWENPIDGLVWENTQFEKPTWDQISIYSNEIELEETKNSKISVVKISRDIFLNLNITVSTGTYKATQKAKNFFCNAVNGRTAAQYPLNWRLSDDVTWVSLSKDEAYELYDAFEAQEVSGYTQETNFIIQVNNATTLEEVNSIVIEFK